MNTRKNTYTTLILVIMAVGLIFVALSCTKANLESPDPINNDATARIYIGLPSNIEEEEIILITEKYFDGATIQEATGLYKGSRETSLVITIINCCRWKVSEETFRENIHEISTELREQLEQDSILIEYNSPEGIELIEVYK